MNARQQALERRTDNIEDGLSRLQERLDQLPAVIARRLSERDIQDNS